MERNDPHGASAPKQAPTPQQLHQSENKMQTAHDGAHAAGQAQAPPAQPTPGDTKTSPATVLQHEAAHAAGQTQTPAPAQNPSPAVQAQHEAAHSMTVSDG